MTYDDSASSAKPAWRHVPPRASSAGAEAIELAASAGLILDPWQREAVIDLLAEDDQGRWAATTGGLICPRQNGKGSVIEALELAWLFLLDVELIFHSAHLFATASDAYRRVGHLIRETPDLHRKVLKYSASHGQEGIELRSGQRLRFVARSKSGGRGFAAPVVVLDEVFNMSKQAMAALVPTMAAQPNPFLLMTSSAPIDDECSDVLRGFMRRTRGGEVPRRTYIEYAATPDTDLEDQVRQANPGYGIRLNADVIAEERELLSPEAFAIERLGIVAVDSETFSVIPVANWAACRDPRHKPTGRLSYALDVSPEGRSCAIACSDGDHVEIVKYEPRTDWVVEACLAQRDAFSEIVLDPAGPAGALRRPLEDAGIPVRDVNLREATQACGLFLRSVFDGTLRHLGQAELDRAAANADRREIGDGGWLWSRMRSTVDIAPLVAVTLAAWAPRASGLSIYEDRGMATL